MKKIALKKLDEIIEKLKQYKSVNGIKPTMLLINELYGIRQQLKDKQISDTIQNDAYKLCVYCGLKTKQKGIGWFIYI